MNRNLIVAPVLGLMLAVAGQAQQKIAVINMQDALVATKDGQKAVADLRGKYAPKDQEFQKRGQELTAKQEQYKKTVNTISEAAKAALEHDIDAMQRTMQRDQDDIKQDMSADEQSMVNLLGQKMMQVISKYAADNQYTAVFDVSGQPNNILYASTASDITQAVIALYDKAAPVTPSAPPSRSPSTSAVPRTSAPAGGAPSAAPKKPITPGAPPK
jgi:outer membrane protein